MAGLHAIKVADNDMSARLFVRRCIKLYKKWRGPLSVKLPVSTSTGYRLLYPGRARMIASIPRSAIFRRGIFLHCGTSYVAY